MVAACEAALERDERRIIAPLPDLDYVEVGPDEIDAHADSRTFENVNTREELERAADRLE
jgi:molybdopterin-guanine dinucleotide biosynthesis protein A